jgi:hypothetical protein
MRSVKLSMRLLHPIPRLVFHGVGQLCIYLRCCGSSGSNRALKALSERGADFLHAFKQMLSM